MQNDYVLKAEAASDLREDIFKIAISLLAFFPFSSFTASIFLSVYSSQSSLTDAQMIVDSFMSSPYFSIYSLTVSFIPIAISILIFCLVTKRRLGVISAKPTVDKKNFTAYTVFGSSAIVLSSVASVLSQKLLDVFSFKGTEIVIPNGLFATAIFVLANVIIAPIIEETLFRFLILERLRRYGDVFAVLASAFMFSMLHASFTNYAYSFVSGIVYGFLAVYTGSMLSPLIIHILNNAISVVLVLLEQTVSKQLCDLIYTSILVVISVISIIGFILLKKLNYNAFALSFDGKPLTKWRKTMVVFSSLPMIIFVVFSIALAASNV